MALLPPLGMRVELVGAKELREQFGRAPAVLMRQWETSTRAELETGVRIIQVRHRSGGGAGNKTTPDATKVITGNLRASYSEDVRREGSAIVGDIGVLRKAVRGQALNYAATHEFGATITQFRRTAWGRPMRQPRNVTFTVPPRPSPDGAIGHVMSERTPLIVARLERDFVSVMGGQVHGG